MRHSEKATKFLKISHKKWKCFFKILWSFKRTWTLQSCYILFQKKGIRKNYQPSLTENRMSSVWNNQQLRAKSISKKKSWNWPITLMPATVSQILTIPTWKLDEQRLQQSIASRKINFHLSIMSSWIACWYSRSPGSRIVLKSRSNSLASHNIRTYNKFIRWFHQFVSRIFSTNFSKFEQLKKETNFLLVQKSFFFSVCQLKKNSIINIRYKNS